MAEVTAATVSSSLHPEVIGAESDAENYRKQNETDQLPFQRSSSKPSIVPAVSAIVDEDLKEGHAQRDKKAMVLKGALDKGPWPTFKP